MIREAVVKDFQSDRVARLWGELNFDLITVSASAQLIMQLAEEGKSDDLPVHEVGSDDDIDITSGQKFEVDLLSPEEFKGTHDTIEEILEEILSHVNFAMARRICNPLEKVFFNSLATRVEELRATLRLIETADGSGEQPAKHWLNRLYGPRCGVSTDFWFARTHDLCEKTGKVPSTAAEVFVDEHLNSGASILDDLSAQKLEDLQFSARDVQTYLMKAETHLFRRAKLFGDLTRGNYRFGAFVRQDGLPGTVYGDYSAFEIPAQYAPNGLGLLETIDRKVNVETRTALCTRELFYRALGESDAAWTLRPLVPMVAKSQNETLLHGLQWFSTLKLRGINRIPKWWMPDGLSMVLNYALYSQEGQMESNNAMLRYACLSLDEVQYIQKMEMKYGKIFANDRFTDWPYLNHQPLDRHAVPICPEPMELILRELLK